MPSLSLESWKQEYAPISEAPSLTVPEDVNPSNIWTVFRYTDMRIITAGTYFINAESYWVTDVPHNFEDIFVPIQDGEEQ